LDAFCAATLAFMAACAFNRLIRSSSAASAFALASASARFAARSCARCRRIALAASGSTSSMAAISASSAASRAFSACSACWRALRSARRFRRRSSRSAFFFSLSTRASRALMSCGTYVQAPTVRIYIGHAAQPPLHSHSYTPGQSTYQSARLPLRSNLLRLGLRILHTPLLIERLHEEVRAGHVAQLILDAGSLDLRIHLLPRNDIRALYAR